MNTNIMEVFLHPPATEPTSPGLQILLKLLDWPFLTVVFFGFFILTFRKPLEELIKRIKAFNFKDGSVELEKLERRLNQEIDSKLENFEDPSLLKESSSVTSVSKAHGAQFANEKSMDKQEISSDPLNRIMEALLSPKFRWRTVPRLAAIAGVSEAEVMTLLRSLEVEFDVNKSGQKIVKLKSR